MVDGAHGKKDCVCSKEVEVSKQHLPRQERGEVRSPRYYQGYPEKNAADPFKSPGGLLSTSDYSLENGDNIQAREAKQMGRNLQHDSSEYEPEKESVDEEPVIVTTPDLFHARTQALKTRNKMLGIPLSIDSSVYPSQLGFTHKSRQKTLEDFLGGPWETLLKIITKEGYFLSHQFVNP